MNKRQKSKILASSSKTQTKELITKITLKKEFSQLPKKEVELAFKKFDKPNYVDEEKIKLTRDLLRKVFSAFTSQKILSLKDKDEKWILRKHLSTRERLPYYNELYERLLKGFNKLSIIDLGAGINGFSYKYFTSKEINYVAVEAMGQLVDLMNNYFKKNNLQKKARAIHENLFELKEIKRIIKETKKPKVIFLFKVLDSLEMLERDYSKKLLGEVAPLVNNVIISFATKSMIKRQKFRVKRVWILNFIKDNFEILDDFELGSERYISFKAK